MKQNLILFLIGIFVLSISCQNQKSKKDAEPVKEVSSEAAAVLSDDSNRNLHSIEEIQAVFEMADVGFYPEIINDPLKALEYVGDRKIAANIGAYMADMLYVLSTSERGSAYENYAAIMELSKSKGLTDDMPGMILERFEEGNTSVDEVYGILGKALDQSNKNLSDNEKAEFSAYLILGNYIEKLYVVTAIIKRPKKTELPAEVEASLKRGLLKYVGQQSGSLQYLLNLMSKYPNSPINEMVKVEVETLKNQYLAIESQREETLKLAPTEFFQNKEVVAIFDQIEKIRTLIVE